jgi:hypothetical protein
MIYGQLHSLLDALRNGWSGISSRQYPYSGIDCPFVVTFRKILSTYLIPIGRSSFRAQIWNARNFSKISCLNIHGHDSVRHKQLCCYAEEPERCG